MGDFQKIPKHVAIIMDGNGRWAQNRGLPRGAGHKAGVKTLRTVVEHSARCKVEVLTVFAFSSENWHRPRQEVDLLLELFLTALRSEVDDLHKNNIHLQFIGDRTAFPDKLQQLMSATETKTAANTGLKLVIAANYGGRWDIVNACRRIADEVAQGRLNVATIDEALMQEYLSLEGLAEPDLLIRTGGEQRLSNYLLWHCAYAELYFSDVLWPEFDAERYDVALQWFEGRQRRFGRIDANQTGHY